MNSKQCRILAEAFANKMLAGVNGLDVDGRDGRVYIAKEIKGAELILQPDGSLSIVGEGITILIRTEDPIDEPTIERLGPSEDCRCARWMTTSPAEASARGWPARDSAASSASTSRPSASTCTSATATPQ